jgi:hypothetical protein
MDVGRRQVTSGLVAAALAARFIGPARAAAAALPDDILDTWYRLILELVRHTPTYSPPVASRAFAYIGVTAYESVAGGSTDLRSLAGQLNGLAALPARKAGTAYDEAVLLNAALADVVAALFSNTGPTGQRALGAMTKKLSARAADSAPAGTVAASEAQGRAIAAHILAWAAADGGAVVENMGFPLSYTPGPGPAAWQPTSKIAQQQAPLLPDWGRNRTFAMPSGATCGLPPPPAYSEDPASPFYAEAREVFDIRANMTEEQRMIARFWSDDPMLSPTPPGHWVSIAMQSLDKTRAPLETRVDVLARLGIALADAFIGCWATKYQYDLLRPVTYIRRTMDPKWDSLMITPPFPEYPSGHSTQSGAAATVLTAAFGEDFAFEDRTHVADGLPGRPFPSFWAAATEAALSRLYGGIHFRSAIEQGLVQGRCIGAYATALTTGS